MQTFLPVPSFQRSAEILDDKRLGKQRVEVLQLLKGSFPNHPVAKMWRGFRNSLVEYGLIICQEWIRRGFNDSCFSKILEFKDICEVYHEPEWLGNEAFHKSHRIALLCKNIHHYSLFPEFTNEILEAKRLFDNGVKHSYVWPV